MQISFHLKETSFVLQAVDVSNQEASSKQRDISPQGTKAVWPMGSKSEVSLTLYGLWSLRSLKKYISVTQTALPESYSMAQVSALSNPPHKYSPLYCFNAKLVSVQTLEAIPVRWSAPSSGRHYKVCDFTEQVTLVNL